MPRADGSKERWNGSTSSALPASTSSSQRAAAGRAGSLRGSRSQATSASASSPAITGYDHELTA